MGYHTDFVGQIMVDPPLNEYEILYLTGFSETRHMDRKQGPFYVDYEHPYETNEEGVYNCNRQPSSQPGLWCDIVPSGDGRYLSWNGNEKPYKMEEWIHYLIRTFLKPDVVMQKQLKDSGMEIFNHFTFDHVCNGEMLAQGEDIYDRWLLVVKDNVVSRKALK